MLKHLCCIFTSEKEQKRKSKQDEEEIEEKLPINPLDFVGLRAYC
jgi:hypothetical protein